MHCEVLIYAKRSALFHLIFLLSKYSPGTSFSSTLIFLFLRVKKTDSTSLRKKKE
jgi:hypothetical protein